MKSFPLPLILSAGLLCLALACSSRDARPSFKGAQDAHVDDSNADNPSVSDTEAGALQLVPDAGSKMRFMNGEALTEVFGRVFKPTASGYAHCEKNKPKDFEGCNLMFTTDERASVGVFDLYSQRMGRGVQNVARAENLTLNYMRNIRAALGRECERLVSAEEKALAESATAPTILVKTNGPSAASLEDFFKKLMGADGEKIDFGVPYAGFADAYKTSAAMGSDKAKGAHGAYVNLCISMAIDPQVFLY